MIWSDNPCYNNPCLNGGTCQANVNFYTCLCANLYSGINCKTCKFNLRHNVAMLKLIFGVWLDSNACSNNPCLNGGVCAITGVGTTYTCSCPTGTGYSGTNCQTCNLHFIFHQTLAHNIYNLIQSFEI